MIDQQDENWFDVLRLGVDLLDEQHREMVSLILGFQRESASHANRRILMDLMRYTREHFRTEEDLMEVHGYPGLVRHRDLHDALLKDVVRFSSGDLSDPQEQAQLHRFLRAWLIRHILQDDADFAEFVRSGGG
jgi:hemerythrin